MVNVGERIETYLHEKRIPKRELVELLGLSRPGLDYKLKANSFKMEELEMISNFIGIELMELIGKGEVRTEYKEPSKSESIMTRILDETRLMREQLRLLSEQLREKDNQISKLLDILGKLDPISEPAKVMSITANEYKPVA